MRTPLLIAAVAAVSALAAGAALACSCMRFDSAAEQLTQADVMFVGRVIATTELEPGRAETRFEVLRTLKGPASREAEVGHTINDGGAACGVEFAAGDTMAVIAYERDGRLETNLCSMPEFPLQDYEALDGELG